jgi:hypothetical protein
MSRESYWLAPHVVACRTVGGLIFLDLEHDRYLGLSGMQAADLPTLIRNWPDTYRPDPIQAPEPTVIDRLIAKHLLVTNPDDARRSFVLKPVPPPYDSGSEAPSPRVSVSHIRAFAWACYTAQRQLRTRSLHSIVCDFSALKHSAPMQNHTPDFALALERVFRRLRPLAFVAYDRCLFHALALLLFLSRFEIYATWVIGVRTNPWAAHSWVQYDQLLLEATPEEVYAYMPIMAV